MQIKTITKNQYILTEEEWELVLKCLRYAKHRHDKHKHCGIHKSGVKIWDLNNLLAENEKWTFEDMDKELDKMLKIDLEEKNNKNRYDCCDNGEKLICKKLCQLKTDNDFLLDIPHSHECTICGRIRKIEPSNILYDRPQKDDKITG